MRGGAKAKLIFWGDRTTKAGNLGVTMPRGKQGQVHPCHGLAAGGIASEPGLLNGAGRAIVRASLAMEPPNDPASPPADLLGRTGGVPAQRAGSRGGEMPPRGGCRPG